MLAAGVVAVRRGEMVGIALVSVAYVLLAVIALVT